MIISAIVGSSNDALKVGECIIKGRIDTSKNVIGGIFGSFQNNKISINHGLNFFSTLHEDLTNLISFFHGYLNQTALKFATMTITCRNGNITSKDQEEWKNISFNSIQRNYYGPSIKYHKDSLNFLHSRYDYRGTYELDLNLKF